MKEPKQMAVALLRRALNNPHADFRQGQWECIQALLDRRRLLVVQRTGWGKSMVYFLATRMLRNRGAGAALLISPLLSLMRNQIQAAERIGIHACTINSNNPDQWKTVQEQMLQDRVDILLISPERLANDDFRENILVPVADRIGLFVVDEAHCISDWGHDFRPDYRRIVRVLNALPSNIPVLATTATANDRVVGDVAGQLGHLRVVRGPLVRKSLRLQNIWMPNPAARMAWLAEHLPQMAGSGIVYTLTKRDAERVAAWLRLNRIEAEAYHSGIENREFLENRLLNNDLKALVATVALGMGFDKPDLGFVIHFQRPGSVVYYYQQVGRAGRAVDQAYGILLAGREDDDITDYFIRNAFPPQMHVARILEALNEAENGLSIPMLEQRVNLSKSQIEKTIKFLSVESPAPVVKQNTRWYATPINYRIDEVAITQLCDLRKQEQREMHHYMETRACLMRFLSQALSDLYADRCGKCANCMGEPLLPETVNPDLANTAALFLRRSYQPLPPRKRWPKNAFREYNFSGKIAAHLMAEEGRALCLWGDAGWGQMVRDGKFRDGRFSDELVDACVRMMEVWKPSPTPTWISCVPSSRRPNLVPDFSARLSIKTGLPFIQCIRKVKENAPQKEMQNSFQQARNTDGVYQIETDAAPGGPVFLLDDMVDSRWTFTVISALLRATGCPAVFPMALALNSP